MHKPHGTTSKCRLSLSLLESFQRQANHLTAICNPAKWLSPLIPQR
jgi:hypothetical protein